ncbi:hypothetical protein E4U16_000395 [Claviceps sp. LM84 group G4]|nr:hypothetical protein E4U16_000395 [Claviceps sp. LM84 group G4]KAG6081846.1 hypothetical protein E4U33_006360 [Claviceps sp. LM78 group G4]
MASTPTSILVSPHSLHLRTATDDEPSPASTIALRWGAEANHIVYKARKHRLRITSNGPTPINTIQFFLVIIADINKTLGEFVEPKQPKTLTEICTELPAPHQIHPDNAPAFLEERSLQQSKPPAARIANTYWKLQDSGTTLP